MPRSLRGSPKGSGVPASPTKLTVALPPSPGLVTIIQQYCTEHVCQANACWEWNSEPGSRAPCLHGVYILVNTEFKFVLSFLDRYAMPLFNPYKILKGTKLDDHRLLPLEKTCLFKMKRL